MVRQFFKSENDSIGIETRLEVLIAILIPFIRSSNMSKNEIKSAEDKAIILLTKGAGLSQIRVAKILGVDINRVNKIVKSSKGF